MVDKMKIATLNTQPFRKYFYRERKKQRTARERVREGVRKGFNFSLCKSVSL